MNKDIELQINDIEGINLSLDVGVKELYPTLENLEVTPTTEQQIFNHENSYGYDSVIVDKIPDEYKITTLGSKIITKNGVYSPIDDNLDGYNEVTVATSGVDINDYFTGSITSGTGSGAVYNKSRIYKIIKKLPDNIPITGTSCNTMFSDCNVLEEAPYMDTSKVTNMNAMFAACYELKSVPLYDTSKVTNMDSMFSNCNALETIPQFNTSNVTGMNAMFSGCTTLKTIPQLDTSKISYMDNMFSNCNALETIPLLDTSNVTSMRNMFYYCKSLKTIPLLNTSKVRYMNSMFQNATNNIESLPELDGSNCINTNLMFSGANNTTCTQFNGIKNLGMAYQSGLSGSSFAFDIRSLTALSHESLVNIINNLYDISDKGLGTIYFSVGNANYNKLTADDIAIATNKGWTVRA